VPTKTGDEGLVGDEGQRYFGQEVARRPRRGGKQQEGMDMTQPITLAWADSDVTMVASAIVRGNLALHGTVNDDAPPWTITHIPTGYAVSRFIHGDEARKALRSLNALGDWAFENPKDALEPPYAKAAVQACNAARRPGIIVWDPDAVPS
jgi:hypothetical protein